MDNATLATEQPNHSMTDNRHPNQVPVDTYSLSVMTDRNQVLAATVYRPKDAVKKAIMIGPATGIKRRFYQSFATYLAENGFGVVTFDCHAEQQL